MRWVWLVLIASCGRLGFDAAADPTTGSGDAGPQGGGDGAPATVRIATYPVAESPQSMTIGDFNGDGIPDLAAAAATVTILLGRGDGTFVPGGTYPTSPGSYKIATGDVDEDGHLDLVVT